MKLCSLLRLFLFTLLWTAQTLNTLSQTVGADRGRHVLAAAQAYAGGAENLRALRDLVITARASQATSQGTLEGEVRVTYVFPNMYREEWNTPLGTTTFFFDGARGWMDQNGRSSDLKQEQKRQIQSTLFRDPFNLLRTEGTDTLSYEGREGSDDVLLVSRGDMSVRLYVDDSGRLMKITYSEPSGAAARQVVEMYSEWGQFATLRLPRRVMRTHDGQKVLEVEITDVHVNTGISPEIVKQKPRR